MYIDEIIFMSNDKTIEYIISNKIKRIDIFDYFDGIIVKDIIATANPYVFNIVLSFRNTKITSKTIVLNWNIINE
jgi:hypothetical protein